jgi:hypothetical protein
MKVILFRFEKEKANFITCDVSSERLAPSKKETVSLKAVSSNGEKYKKILDELVQIGATYKADFYAYVPSIGFRGKVDEVRYANEAMLNLFCHEQGIKLLSLAPPTVRRSLSLSSATFKDQVETEKKGLIEKNAFSKSDVILDGLTYLSLLRGTF